jgi:hypothetical protein
MTCADAVTAAGRAHDRPPADPGLVRLSVRDDMHLLAAALRQSRLLAYAARWFQWQRRHQALSRWFHKRARLACDHALVS